MKKKAAFIFAIIFCGLVFTSFSPSLDGRAEVASPGVMPKGIFARTVGYLPGDSISVTNLSTKTSVDILVIGALDPSEGIAILLSPEAAELLGMKKDGNNVVKITKRSGQLDEQVSGTAVIGDGIYENENVSSKNEDVLEPKNDSTANDSIAEENLSNDEVAAENFEDSTEEDISSNVTEPFALDSEKEIAKVDEPKTSEYVPDVPSPEEFDEVDVESDENIVESADEPLVLDDESGLHETEHGNDEVLVENEEKVSTDERIEENPDSEIDKPDATPFYEEDEEKGKAERLEFENEEQKVNDELSPEIPETEVEDKTLPDEASLTPFEEENEEPSEPETDETEIKEELPEEDLPSDSDLEETEEEEIPEPKEETEPEEELEEADEAEEIEDEPLLENIEADELSELDEPLDDEGDVDDEEIPSESEEVPENDEDEYTAPEESETEDADESIEETPEESVEEENLSELPLEKSRSENRIFENPSVEETDEDFNAPEETGEDDETYAPIVLVPSEPNPPLPIETPDENESEKVENNLPVPEEKPLENKISDAEEKVPLALEKSSDWKDNLVSSEDELEKGKWFVQIAVLSSEEGISSLVSKYGEDYPIVVIPMKSGNGYKILVGPLSMDEYGTVLNRFKSYGYKDAFLKIIK